MPNDAFGQHLASSSRFADEVGLELAVEELIVYFANILMPHQRSGGQGGCEGHRGRLDVRHDRAEPRCHLAWPRSTHPCRRLRPLHLGRHVRQARHRLRDHVGLDRRPGPRDRGWRYVEPASTSACSISRRHPTRTSRATSSTRELCFVGSPTLHHGMLYRPAGYLQYLCGLKPKDKIAGAFGSYGWSSGATKQMTARLEEIGLRDARTRPHLQVRAVADGHRGRACVGSGVRRARARDGSDAGRFGRRVVASARRARFRASTRRASRQRPRR